MLFLIYGDRKIDGLCEQIKPVNGQKPYINLTKVFLMF